MYQYPSASFSEPSNGFVPRHLPLWQGLEYNLLLALNFAWDEFGTLRVLMRLAPTRYTRYLGFPKSWFEEPTFS